MVEQIANQRLELAEFTGERDLVAMLNLFQGFLQLLLQAITPIAWAGEAFWYAVAGEAAIVLTTFIVGLRFQRTNGAGRLFALLVALRAVYVIAAFNLVANWVVMAAYLVAYGSGR